jgi:drug/metabolite transporter (DMT)-like permease
VRPTEPLIMQSALQMLAGGGVMLALGLAWGEGARIELAAISARSVWALVYLIVGGALAGFCTFSWLNQVAPPRIVGTYAYVNPLVAVLLGWALGGEPLEARLGFATLCVVGSVALVVGWRKRAGGETKPSLSAEAVLSAAEGSPAR